MLPQKCLKICISKIAISSILRQISYSSTTSFLLVNFAFEKKIQMGRRGGGGGAQVPQSLLDALLPKQKVIVTVMFIYASRVLVIFKSL